MTWLLLWCVWHDLFRCVTLVWCVTLVCDTWVSHITHESCHTWLILTCHTCVTHVPSARADSYTTPAGVGDWSAPAYMKMCHVTRQSNLDHICEKVKSQNLVTHVNKSYLTILPDMLTSRLSRLCCDVWHDSLSTCKSGFYLIDREPSHVWHDSRLTLTLLSISFDFDFALCDFDFCSISLMTLTLLSIWHWLCSLWLWLCSLSLLTLTLRSIWLWLCSLSHWLCSLSLLTLTSLFVSSDSFVWRGGGLGSRPKKMYGERLGDGVEYHLMKPTPRR